MTVLYALGQSDWSSALHSAIAQREDSRDWTASTASRSRATFVLRLVIRFLIRVNFSLAHDCTTFVSLAYGKKSCTFRATGLQLGPSAG
jgi:hypothetical protein